LEHAGIKRPRRQNASQGYSTDRGIEWAFDDEGEDENDPQKATGISTCCGMVQRYQSCMLLFREKIPADWLPKVLKHVPEVLVDHAHLERKAATSALNLEKYRDLYSRVDELNTIAIEELQHFQLVLELLKRRGIPFGQPFPSPWISGLMRSVRNGQRWQVIDHLICCALIEGRSCEKFQILATELQPLDPELAQFYASLVESEGNHYATYLLMARGVDERETERRLDFYLELDAKLMAQPNPHLILH
jgi:tRNA 2-(methylsulfanyl)-N6-isopentenyladenosine37 hydroxylase